MVSQTFTWYPNSLACKIQCNSHVRAHFAKTGDRQKTHPWFSMSLDSANFLSLGPYTTSITTVSQQLVMFIRHKINEQPRLQKTVAKTAFLNSRFGKGTNTMIFHTRKPKMIRRNPTNMPHRTSTITYERPLSATTNLSQSTGFRTSKNPLPVKILGVGLNGTTAFSGLQTYESVNLQKK